MIVTVASGKGGTSKTPIATSLAISLAAELNTPPLFLDCDVEAPNANLFLQPVFTEHQDVAIFIPVIDEQQCNYCAKCTEIYQYQAIAVVGIKTMIFPQLCPRYGSCMALCPEKAIEEVHDRIGLIENGKAESKLTFARGILDVGEPMAVPVIHQLKKWVFSLHGKVVVCDAQPRTSCPVGETARGSESVLLLTEPTPFGLHDLSLATQMAEDLGIRAGVMINRENGPYPELEMFCGEHHLAMLLRISFERISAEGITQGKLLVDIHPDFRILLFCMFIKTARQSRKV